MLFANLLGVLGVVTLITADQSDSTEIEEQPIATQVEEKRRLETPEVVLQLKYDRGELNRIYLAQFRKGNVPWTPSVSARNDLCADLCHAGLGGEVCGSTCTELMAVGLKSALNNASDAGATFGHPRVEVCPALCHNGLGVPLCNCPTTSPVQSDDITETVNWYEICGAFCGSDNYVLRGCPSCDPTAMQPTFASSRALNTADGWVAWCNAQCRQGHGGAACNCDRPPL